MGNPVLAGIDLEVRAGEVHAIVGENGAGKSTLIKILGGVHQPDAGEVIVDGAPRRLRSPRDALAAGIVVIHQELSLAPHLSVEENIFLGRFPRTAFGTVDRSAIRKRVAALFAQLAIAVDPERPTGTLSIAQQQMVEIAKAISVEARVLVLDEPTAVLDEQRVATLFGTVGRLRGQGLGIVFISHHLEEIFRIADRVTVLRDGRITGTAKVADVDQDWLVSRMIGRDFPAHSPQVRKAGRPALAIEGLSVPGQFADVSLTVGQGEIVGLAGLVGAGRSEVARALVGLDRPSGIVRLFGTPVTIRNPNAAARLGIVYVTEDRKSQGLLPNRPVRENLTISNLRRFASAGLLRLGAEARYVRDMIKSLDVRLAGSGVEIRTLSGGNQQKVLIGRALTVGPRILILDEPTRGVDIGAKQEIYALIERLVAGGMAVLLISSEMEEVLRLADRVVVLRRGRVAATLSREEASESTIMKAAALAA
ncbi:MAG TPA: sugar ABC transporter ATP-binding protein [Lichenihabitans sp.]|nr:sugar ABC transporter ATP-binding protein [Lichenihabitans sp.]